MQRSLLAVAVAAVFAANAHAEPTVVNGPMAFDPIPASAYQQGGIDLATAPWVIPAGYTQSIVSDENDLDIYAGVDWNDMNTVNESKSHAGRFLYRTHEVRTGNDARNDGELGGSVSVVDLQTGEAREVATRYDWEALDGIVWTPWHTILFAEETITSARPDPDHPAAVSGLVYELKLDPADPTTAVSVTVRPQLGALSHEGLEIDAEGNVYVIDEERTGAIYKFVPETRGDLSSGQLYSLRVASATKTGVGEWVELDMEQVQVSARVAAKAVGATSYCRPEDIERIASTLYVALTCEDVNNPTSTGGPGAVMAVSLGNTPSVNYVVAAGRNVPVENRGAGITGFRGVDNLADGPDGKLWMVEDNAYSDIWVFDPNSTDDDGDGYRDGVFLFASLKDVGAEGTGIYFGTDPQTLFVNVQHSDTGNDKTMAITRRRQE